MKISKTFINVLLGIVILFVGINIVGCQVLEEVEYSSGESNIKNDTKKTDIKKRETSKNAENTYKKTPTDVSTITTNSSKKTPEELATEFVRDNILINKKEKTVIYKFPTREKTYYNVDFVEFYYVNELHNIFQGRYTLEYEDRTLKELENPSYSDMYRLVKNDIIIMGYFKDEHKFYETSKCILKTPEGLLIIDKNGKEKLIRPNGSITSYAGELNYSNTQGLLEDLVINYGDISMYLSENFDTESEYTNYIFQDPQTYIKFLVDRENIGKKSIEIFLEKLDQVTINDKAYQNLINKLNHTSLSVLISEYEKEKLGSGKIDYTKRREIRIIAGLFNKHPELLEVGVSQYLKFLNLRNEINYAHNNLGKYEKVYNDHYQEFNNPNNLIVTKLFANVRLLSYEPDGTDINYSKPIIIKSNGNEIITTPEQYIRYVRKYINELERYMEKNSPFIPIGDLNIDLPKLKDYAVKTTGSK